MKTWGTMAMALALVLGGSIAAQAGDVAISGAHICCGACVKAVQATLKDVPGVSEVTAKQAGGTITYKAADDKAAAAGIEALAKAGFHGAAKHGDAALAYPASGVEKDAMAEKITLTGIHLCCPACYVAAEKALKGVPGVTQVMSNKAAKEISVSGKATIKIAEVVDALYAAGFHPTVKK